MMLVSHHAIVIVSNCLQGVSSNCLKLPWMILVQYCQTMLWCVTKKECYEMAFCWN